MSAINWHSCLATLACILNLLCMVAGWVAVTRFNFRAAWLALVGQLVLYMLQVRHSNAARRLRNGEPST